MCAVALGLVLATSWLQAAESYEVTTERGVTVTMRDGVILRADIYRPNAEGRFPVLLQRTPYNKSGGVAFGLEGGGARIRCHHSGRARPLHLRRRMVHLQT